MKVAKENKANEASDAAPGECAGGPRRDTGEGFPGGKNHVKRRIQHQPPQRRTPPGTEQKSEVKGQQGVAQS